MASLQSTCGIEIQSWDHRTDITTAASPLLLLCLQLLFGAQPKNTSKELSVQTEGCKKAYYFVCNRLDKRQGPQGTCERVQRVCAGVLKKWHFAVILEERVAGWLQCPTPTSMCVNLHLQDKMESGWGERERERERRTYRLCVKNRNSLCLYRNRKLFFFVMGWWVSWR